LFQRCAIDKDDEYLSKLDTDPEQNKSNEAAAAAGAEDLDEIESEDVRTGDMSEADEDEDVATPADSHTTDYGDMSEADEDVATPADSHTTDTEEEEEEELNAVSEERSPAVADRSENHLTCRWSTGTGPRIRCVRDYPQDLQSRALEHVNLSPRLAGSPSRKRDPVPSPRPSPGMILSPRLASVGFQPRTVSLKLPDFKRSRLQ
jgi:hypothetical protein